MARSTIPGAGEVALRDGSTVSIRPITPADEAGLLKLFQSLSPESKKYRFFSVGTDLAAVAGAESQISPAEGVGLVAIIGSDGRIVGHVAYRVSHQDCADIDTAVAEDHQRLGIGTLLLARLAEVADERGIRTFHAEMLPDNLHALDVIREAGFPVEVNVDQDLVELFFPTRLTEEALLRFERRDQVAAASALEVFLKPRAVAVIGASRQRGTPGAEAFHNLIAAQFSGPVYPVNHASDVVQSVKAYPSIDEVLDPVDLAVIAVPADLVVEVAEQCGRKGVRGLLVLSSGFAEVGEQGHDRQEVLLRVCHRYGMRLIGPNCLGVANTDPAVRLNATFGPVAPTVGRVGFMSQSGALGLAVMQYAASRGIGLSSFISVGNKADISGNDLLNYWETDPRTDVIVLYLESVGNPRKFVRIARRVGKQKPIVVVKSGRSTAGARATSSHTGALLAASDVTVDALFRQAGVIRTDTLEELFDVVALLSQQPLPVGRGVGIVTNAGGPAILSADACEAAELVVPVLAAETQDRLKDFLPPIASLSNPVDMTASATAEHYQRAIAAVANDPNVHAVIVLFIEPLMTGVREVAHAIRQATQSFGGTKPVLSVLMTSDDSPPAAHTNAELRLTSYRFPESAARALGHAARYAVWRSRPLPVPAAPVGIRRDQAFALVASGMGEGGWLDPTQAAELFACYGLPLVEQRVVSSPGGAAEAAREIGGAVALKGIAPGILHKTEAGLVRLNLQGTDAVRRAAEAMVADLAPAGKPAPEFLVQRMVPPGVEMIVGLVHDPQFGPVLACGAGGVLVELLRDMAIRLTPVSRDEAREMIRSLKTYPLLQGYRGSPACDVAALEDVLLRVSALAEDLPQVAELDLNPVVVSAQGAQILDCRIRLHATQDSVVTRGRFLRGT